MLDASPHHSRKTVPFIERRFLSRAASQSASKENISQLRLRQSFHKSASIPRNTDTLFPSLFSSSSFLRPTRCTVGQRNTTNQLPSRGGIISRKGHEGGEVARSNHLKERDGRGGGSGVRGLENRRRRRRASKEIMKLRARKVLALLTRGPRREVRRGKI